MTTIQKDEITNKLLKWKIQELSDNWILFNLTFDKPEEISISQEKDILSITFTSNTNFYSKSLSRRFLKEQPSQKPFLFNIKTKVFILLKQNRLVLIVAES